MHMMAYYIVTPPAAFVGALLGYLITDTVPGTIVSMYLFVILAVGLAAGFIAQREVDKEDQQCSS